MKSQIFNSDRFRRVESDLADFLDAQDGFLTKQMASSPRAMGDAVQGLIADHFDQIIGKDIIKTYAKESGRRAMADLTFEDI